MRTAVFVAGPMLLAGMVVGLAISIFQAATQINEMTMTFVPKILTVFLVLILTLPWAISQMTRFTGPCSTASRACRSHGELEIDITLLAITRP